jgi:hypothetical protein
MAKHGFRAAMSVTNWQPGLYIPRDGGLRHGEPLHGKIIVERCATALTWSLLISSTPAHGGGCHASGGVWTLPGVCGLPVLASGRISGW